MQVDIKAPHYPESIQEGTLVKWHKQEGDAVRTNEKLADIETDKVVLEVAAAADGVLTGVQKKEGDTVLDEEILARIETSSSAVAAPPVPAPGAAGADAGMLSPAVRKLVAQEGLDVSQVQGTGKGGRVTKADVLQHLESARGERLPSPTPVPAPASLPPPAATDGDRPVTRVPMTRIRARIAERLVQVQQTAAMLTTFNEINMQAISDLRRRYKDSFEKNHGVKLGFMSFFVKASVEALKQFPVVNASVDGNDIVYNEYYDIGIAVSTDRGLVVPVLRDADRMTFAQIEKTIEQFAHRAREGQLTIDELTGGTFTITNGGVFGSLLSTPILNPPQSAILGMHTIQARPVVEDGQVVARPMMYLALTYDHRIVDGREAVQFLVAIKQILEEPARLLLQV